ncbi:ABC transporter ATP-binding protein [Candidatus Laterigemmans baculatus]|uniref:ABC transporter ATP-binding protein n=1 Tax=Candidatus Laterigemmans baculatus TaxID=2770505 RepID=UPI0013DCD6F3|nr:ABC transporter ATP-binding protein [Candidatus Laterigemmans baculatus]
MSVLQAQGITCGYADRTVLDRVSLELHPGEVAILLGANGAGKTTLLRALSRRLEPRAGQVLLDRQELSGFGNQQLARQIALMPQNERRDWPLSVVDAVSLGRAPHRGWMLPMTSRDRLTVERALELTCLRELRDRPITELSGGEWRRMVLARAIAQEAKILLLDEPTAGLDVRYQVEMLALVKRMAAEQKMVIMLTLHDLNHASLYGDHLILLHDGQIVATGKPADVLHAERIEAAFGIRVMVIPHPVYETPLVVPLDPMDQEPVADRADES